MAGRPFGLAILTGLIASAWNWHLHRCLVVIRPARIFSITGRSMMAAMMFSSPAPQFGHRSTSMTKRSFSAD
jgi:hypothetical protein